MSRIPHTKNAVAPWQATLDGYEPSDPIGYGATEAEAIADLQTQIEQRKG
jgi:hypothetical protein